ncbi:protein FAM110C [Suricata suricatta]|uniref:protein FAM110C n=1 Tax=Suricata suricatta TaxID=37032 RepID=UPI001155A733|nr:protein FAM110C [Suricata suricatta]
MRALPALDAPQNERLVIEDPKAPRARDAAVPARRSAVERLAADRAKYVRGPPGGGPGPAPEGSSPRTCDGTAGDPRSPARVPGVVARRAIARKPLRPDSLVIYRQKCDFVRVQGANSSMGGLVRKLFQGPGKDKTPVPPETSRVGEEVRARTEEAVPPEPGSMAASAAPGVLSPPAPRAPPARLGTPPRARAEPRGPELLGTRRGGLQRSQSDLSSRYSATLSESDTFFQFCGLEPEVVEALGRENFSAGSDRVTLKVRSVSVATSDSGFSRHSGGEEGLQEEELTEQVPSTTSVVDRNARIIKWLYTCKKARETPGQGLQGPA